MPATDQRTQLSLLQIKVNGTALQPAELAQVVDVTVEQDLNLPDAFAIRIRDVDDVPTLGEQGWCKLLDQDRFPIGANIEIDLGREAAPQLVLQGEITSLDLDLQWGGAPMVAIRGYDGSHRLHRERKSRTFVNSSDSDIASRVAREHGLTPRADATTVVHEHVFQDNLTDWEFLRLRANRVGFELFVRDSTLYFRRSAPSGTAPEKKLGTTLQRLRLRLSASPQVGEVIVQGWDPTTKRPLVGRASRATSQPRIAERRTGAQLAASGFSAPGKFVLAEQPVGTQGEADALAQAIYDEIAGHFLELEAVCLGDPQLRPGGPIKISGGSARFDGEYYLSAVTHKVTPHEGYLAHVTVSGRRPNTLSALLNGARPGQRASAPGGHPGVVVGVVTNNKDPNNRGRVKVKFPWLAPDESNWARLASPMAGASRGFYWLPEVNDEVLVAFEHGDIDRPCVIGAVWNGTDAPPVPANQVVGPTGKVNQRIIKSRLGHTVTLDDSDQAPSITIVDKTGNNTIKLDSLTNAITVKAQGNLTLEASAQVLLKGATVNIESSGPLNLKGSIGSVEASGPLKIKGAVVNIN